MIRSTLGDLKLGLQDLLDKRHGDLVRAKAGRFHEPSLREQLEAIGALPPQFTGGAPLSEELAAVDAEHDGYGAAIYFLTEAYLRLPDAPASLLEAAKRVRAEFIPALGELSASYATEAEKAASRRPLLRSMKKDLEAFPVAGDESLLEVATAFVDAGERLNTLLTQRADASPGSRKDAGKVRSDTLGVLNRLRGDLAREVERDPKLPRDLEARVFGYFDTLETMRRSASGPAKTPAASPPATPPKGDPPKP